MKILVVDDRPSVLDFLADCMFLVAREKEPDIFPLIRVCLPKKDVQSNTKIFNRKINTYKVTQGLKVPVSALRRHRLRSRR